MKSKNSATATLGTRLGLGAVTLLLCSLSLGSIPALAQTPLADGPVFSANSVPGNLGMVLSVEFPTAISVAHTNRTYANTSEYLGFFDPNKCYDYRYTDGTSTDNYFYPNGVAASDHVCTGKWSGNFLNWASMQTIDPFRWVLTGGYRVIDQPALTVMEKAWGTTQGSKSNFPDSTLASSMLAGATPFPASATAMYMRIWGLGNKMRFTLPTARGRVSSLDGASAAAYNPQVALTSGGVYEVFMRAKVCDPAAPGGVEANCTAYGTNWKPEGLLQKYANKIRYSALGYLNTADNLRDGGVLRARQKFVGPNQPVAGSTPITNAMAEWSASTGVFVRDPNLADSTATNTLFGTNVLDSGVINYVNKFGEITPGSYKTYDNVSELYYAAVRYFKNLGNVPEWTDMTGASTATKTTYVDGFPVITTWDDPILYSCQKNFILGIGDTHTWDDKNVPHASVSLPANEPPMPAAVSADTSVDAVIATNKVGQLEGLGNAIGLISPWGTCCSNNSALMAGLAYDSHTQDIRPDPSNPKKAMQTIDTYWVDVQEYQTYDVNNKYYLATKYGGFTVPAGYDPYGNTTPLTESWWHTTTDVDPSSGQKRPDNYFSGGRPDLMKAGLETAFANIASKIKPFTTSFATSLPQVATAGNSSYSSLYDASSWTGEIIASNLSFDATTFAPTSTEKWRFTDKLATQLASNGWSTNRRVATWTGSAGAQFCSGGGGCTLPITAAQLLALNPSYAIGTSASYLNYLRGDTTNEQGSTGGTKAYRTRTKLLGDIVGSKARPVGPPSYPFSDSANPGYSAFKATWAGRPTVVYVGANDGMMHAIRGDLSSPPGGVEMFAYVPSALFQGPNNTPSVDGLASLGNPSFSHHFMVNATPNVYDVDFARTGGASGSADWHSILIGGLGKGGRSYYAIDVTDPVGMATGGEAVVASKVLWEFTNTDLGYTYGDPIVVKTVKYGWVVIIPSGYNNTDGQGHLLILNPKTGALLEKVSTGVGSPANSAGLAFANAFVLDSSNGTIDAVYAGDLLGNLWRWDVTAAAGAYPAPLKMATLTDSGGAAQPVTSRPKIEVYPGQRGEGGVSVGPKQRFVLVGTGRLLDPTDISNSQNQSFYAIADGTNAHFNAAADLPASIRFPITRAQLAPNINALVGVTFDATTQIGWFEDLGTGSGGIGWRVTTDATTLLGSVAWAATLPNGSVCSPSGDSRIYGRDFASSITTVKTLTSGSLNPALYVSISGNVTDLRYLSVNGKATLISGTDIGGVQKIEISPPPSLGLRRLNWRELQTAD